MPDDPRAPELLDAVARWLRDELPGQLAPGQGAAFHVRVAAHAVETAAREIRGGAATDGAAAHRLRELLGRDRDDDADTAALEAELVARLRDGRQRTDDPPLIDHLWQTTLAKLAIDQPGYAPYRRELARRRES
jgi:hypothetical protein